MPDIGYLETEARTSTNYSLALLHSTACVRASTSLCLPSAMPKLPTGVNVDIVALLIDISLISKWFSTLQLKRMVTSSISFCCHSVADLSFVYFKSYLTEVI